MKTFRQFLEEDDKKEETKAEKEARIAKEREELAARHRKHKEKLAGKTKLW